MWVIIIWWGCCKRYCYTKKATIIRFQVGSISHINYQYGSLLIDTWLWWLSSDIIALYFLLDNLSCRWIVCICWGCCNKYSYIKKNTIIKCHVGSISHLNYRYWILLIDTRPDWLWWLSSDIIALYFLLDNLSCTRIAQWGQPLLLDAVAGIMGLVMDLKIHL